MNAIPNANLALHALSEPLVCFGPGGDFVTQIVADECGEMISVSQRSSDVTAQAVRFVEEPIDWLERLLGIGARLVGHSAQESPKPPTANGLKNPNSTTAGRALSMIRNEGARGAPPPTVYVYRRVAMTLSNELNKSNESAESHEQERMTQTNESHPQTNADFQLCSPVQTGERILPDSARNRGRTRREQGHRVRTCGGARGERCAETQSEQGSLFI